MQLGISVKLTQHPPRGSVIPPAVEAVDEVTLHDTPVDPAVYNNLVIPLPGVTTTTSTSSSSKRTRPADADAARERAPSKRPLLLSSSGGGGAASLEQRTAEDLPVTSDAYQRVPVSAFGAAMLRGMGVQVDADGRVDGGKGASSVSMDATVARNRAAGTAYLGLGATTQASEALLAKKASSGTIVKPPSSQATPAPLVSARHPWLRVADLVWVLPRRSAAPPTIPLPTVPPHGCLGVVKAIDGVPGLEQCMLRVRACDVGEPQTGAATVLLIHPKRDTRAVQDGETRDGAELLKEHARAEKEENADSASADATISSAGVTDDPLPSSQADATVGLLPHPQVEGAAPATVAPRGLSEAASWLWPGIRVRVIDESWEGGRWWKAKGRVQDVTGHGLADVLLEGEGGSTVLRTAVRADQLCTALPKVGGRVRIVRGGHKGGLAVLVWRDSAAGRAQIRVLQTDEIVAVSLDDIAEAVGT